MNPETWASVGVSIATAGAGVWAARSARRTPKQERRDDFTAVTEQQGKAIERLEKRIERGEVEAEKQRDQITGQGAAISWLVTDRHSLVGYIRKAGLEPPAPRPIPIRARPYLDHIDV